MRCSCAAVAHSPGCGRRRSLFASAPAGRSSSATAPATPARCAEGEAEHVRRTSEPGFVHGCSVRGSRNQQEDDDGWSKQASHADRGSRRWIGASGSARRSGAAAAPPQPFEVIRWPRAPERIASGTGEAAERLVQGGENGGRAAALGETRARLCQVMRADGGRSPVRGVGAVGLGSAGVHLPTLHSFSEDGRHSPGRPNKRTDARRPRGDRVLFRDGVDAEAALVCRVGRDRPDTDGQDPL